MASIIIHHSVKDYAIWKKVFDSGTNLRTSSGVLSTQVYREASDPNKITVITKWNSLANAQNFAQSPELKADLEKAGVMGTPTVHFLNEA